MTNRPDPDQTRAIHVPPPAEPTRPLRTPPPAGPTRRIRTPPQRRPTAPNPPSDTQSPQQAGSDGELPWWQTVNRERRTPVSAPPIDQPPPSPRHPFPGLISARPTPAPVGPSPRTPSQPQRRRVVLVICLAAALIAAIAIGAMLGTATKPSETVLDIAKAQQEIAHVLTDPVNGYGVTSLGTVLCNNGANPVVRKENSFTCDVVVGGSQRRVAVVFQDDEGTYAVDRPR